MLNDQHRNPGFVGEVSDIPKLRRQHSTAGYRDGVAHAKTQSVQEGFDEGYPLGSRLGARVGALVGLLEGLVAASRTPTSSASFTSAPFMTPSSTAKSPRREDGNERHPMKNWRGKQAISISYGEAREGEKVEATKDISRRNEAEIGEDDNNNSNNNDSGQDQEMMMTARIRDRIPQLLRDAKRELMDLTAVAEMINATDVDTVDDGDAVDEEDQSLHDRDGYGDTESGTVHEATVTATNSTINTTSTYTTGNPNVMNSSQSRMEEKLDKWTGIIRHEISSLGLHIELDQSH